MVFFKSRKVRELARSKKRALKLRRLDAQAEILGKRAKVEKFKAQITRAKRSRSQDFRMKIRSSDRNFSVSDAKISKDTADDRLKRIF